MRLINVLSYKLEEFYGNDIPSYAILSHRWAPEEVLFHDIQTPHGRNKKGWIKITKCCELAKSHGWDYVWIDTCCIDKSSSAELSEAINSMFEWYASAGVCYVYLSDVTSVTSQEGSVVGQTMMGSFLKSEWFRRGWTLQELLAPARMMFLDYKWSPIGNKQSLSTKIAKATHIAKDHLFDFSTASIAQKMSWASERRTTRAEDEAYSLLGLFGVHMPLLYGEGKNAFLRLQLEILKISEDVSILAWSGPPSGNVLAGGVIDFMDAGHITPMAQPSHQPSLQMTSRGLVAEIMLHLHTNGQYHVPLEVDDSQVPSWIALTLTATSDGRYQRVSLSRFSKGPGKKAPAKPTSICINQTLTQSFGDVLLRHVVVRADESSRRSLALFCVQHIQNVSIVPNVNDQTNRHASLTKSESLQYIDYYAETVTLKIGEICLFHVMFPKFSHSEIESTTFVPWLGLGFALYAIGMVPCLKVWPWSPTSEQKMFQDLASTEHLQPPRLECVLICLDSSEELTRWLMIRMQSWRHPAGGTVELSLSHKSSSDRRPPQEANCEVVHHGGCEIRYYYLPKVAAAAS